MCNKCNERPEIPCGCKPKGCKERGIETDCLILSGLKLPCTNIEAGTSLTSVLNGLDAAICELTTQNVSIVNTGAGSQVYSGDTLQGAKQLRTLRSTNGDLTITQTGTEITFTVSAKGADVYTSTGVLNSATGIVTFTRTDNSTYTLDLSSLIQVQSNVLEVSTSSKAFIQNKNPTKTITSNYTLTTADNNYVIVVDNNATNITITIGTGLPSDNYFVGFVQKGTGLVTFASFDIKPLDLAPVIYGQGHNAAVEIISGTKFLFGTLKSE